MIVTDEMIEVAAAALWDEPYSTQKVRAALTAAYPLICAQALEEAASLCDRLQDYNNNLHRLDVDMAKYPADCARAIRGMKEDK